MAFSVALHNGNTRLSVDCIIEAIKNGEFIYKSVRGKHAKLLESLLSENLLSGGKSRVLSFPNKW